MSAIIKEEHIRLYGFAQAAINNNRRWYMVFHYIIDSEDINKEVVITFESEKGTKTIRTNITAVIENYVKIKQDVIIPLSSITNVNYKEVPYGTNNDFWKFSLIILLIIFLFIAIVFYVVLR